MFLEARCLVYRDADSCFVPLGIVAIAAHDGATIQYDACGVGRLRVVIEFLTSIHKG